MPWCRRDPSLWRIHRLQRTHTAPHRRSLSHAPSRAARHDDRPAGVSDREWAQLQTCRAQVVQYRRWRRKLHEDPYRALFGASEDMLRGKGLRDWVPAWMMESGEGDGAGRREKGDRSAKTPRDENTRYPKRVQVVNENERGAREREPSFREPSYKSTIFDREDFGIVSPSDLRRPREGPYVKVVGNKDAAKSEPSKLDESLKPSPPKAAQPSQTPALEAQEKPINLNTTAPKPSFSAERIVASPSSNSSFVDDFFANKPHQPTPDAGEAKDSKHWRQTTLQRRETAEVGAKPTMAPLPAVISTVQTTLPSQQGAFTIPSSQAVGNILYGFPHSTGLLFGNQVVFDKPKSASVELLRKNVQDAVKPALPTEPITRKEEEKEETVSTAPVRSTSAILEQLPKDDVDFLTAADLRAVMAGKKAAIKGMGNKELERQNLEKAFASTTQDELDPMIESSVVNNQFVRRTQRAMQETREPKFEYQDAVSYSQDVPSSTTASPPLESSVDRMKRWLEEGSTSLTKHFWQDPIDESGPSQQDMQFFKQTAGFGKGRRAVVHIVDDLKKDIPASCELLETLDRDQSRVEQVIQLLRHPKPTKYQVEVSKSLRVIKERRLRRQFEMTEKQFDAARKALRESQDATAASSVSSAFKNRLDVASKIFHKNATLTRTLMWSAQARLEDPDVNRAKVELYSEVLSRMTTLRDTQLALARLVDYAMQVYGVVPKPAQEFAPRAAAQDTSASPLSQQAQIPSVQAKSTTLGTTHSPVANAHLDNEVQALKSAMQGLSDDGYARAPKQTPTKPLETPNPLAHSLFRPFSLQLESLAKEPEVDITAEKLREDMRKKESDRALVEEIRKAYEDTYGQITAEHVQIPDDANPLEKLAESHERAFGKLKEDPVERSEEVMRDLGLQDAAPAVETTPKETAAGDVQETPVLENDSTEVVSEPPAAANEASATSTSSQDPTEASTTASPVETDPSASTVETAISEPTPTNLQTNYTILLHDPQTDTLTLTTSTTPTTPTHDPTPALPLHTALATLTTPSKFLPHIPAAHEIITAKPDMLILRAATHSTPTFETTTAAAPTDTAKSTLNPIDGTARLSPTGYVGVQETQEHLDREFAARRDAAARSARVREGARGEGEKGARGGRNAGGKARGGLGAVVRTAIWAGAACYVVGVLGEVVR